MTSTASINTAEVTFSGKTPTNLPEFVWENWETVTHVALDYDGSEDSLTSAVFIHASVTDDQGRTHYVVSHVLWGISLDTEVVTDKDEAWEIAAGFACYSKRPGYKWDIALDKRIPAVSHRERPAGR